MGNENGKIDYVKRLPSKLDLLKSTQDHFTYVQELNFNTHLFHPKVVQYAIFRYQAFWLPFAAKHANKMLVAPADLELIWVVHVLNREAYARDCMKIAKQLIPHTTAPLERRLDNGATKTLWEAMYADKMPLFIDHKKFPDKIPPYENIISINAAEEVAKYRQFCRQVSLPHYKDPKFLQAAVYTYLQEAITAEKDSAPRIDIEFIWRTHRLTPLAYAIDGNMLSERFGTRVRQYHSLRNKPKSAGSYSVAAPTMIRGAMYRGDVTPLISSFDHKKLSGLANKTLNFHILGYRLANITENRNYRLRVRTKSLLTLKESTLQTFRVSGEGNIVIQTFPDKSEDNSFDYNSAVADVVQIKLSQISMTNSSVSVTTADTRDQFTFDYDFFNCDGFSAGKESKLEFSLPSAKGEEDESEEKSWIRIRCDRITIGAINVFFAIKKSHVFKSDHFCNVLGYPMMMAPYATKRSKEPCIYVSRPLKDRRNETMFKCRILRTVRGNFFSTEVFDFNEKLVSSSYTAGKEALPSEGQVFRPEVCCILREKVETVFIIRSSNTEWALLKVFHVATKENHIIPREILLLNMKDIHLRWVVLYNHEDEQKKAVLKYKIRDAHILIDLVHGKLSVSPSVNLFPELLSLGVTILSLFHCFPYKDTLGAT